jgi:ABC-type bacteriocin/lantibiotic exporter with double-glycine peptidase domain
MPTRQAATVVQRVAHALGAEADPTVWTADLRRNGVVPRTLDDLAEGVAELARRLDVTLLARTPDALGDLVRAEAFPLVVLAEAAPRRIEAFVLLERRRDRVRGVQVGMDGDEQPVTVRGDRVDSELAALLGGAGDAADGRARALRCYVPVSVAPSVGGPAPADGSRDAAPASGPVVTSGGLAVGEAPHAGHHGPSPAARLWALLARERRDVLLVFGYATLAGLFSLALPLSIQQIVQLVSGRMLLQPTYILVAFVLLGTVGVGVLQVMQLSVVETIQQRIFARLALEFSFRVPRLRYEVALREDLPEVMNRFFETVNVQKSLSKLLIDLSTSLLTILFGLVLLTLYHPYFTFFSAALVLGLAAIFWVTGPKGLATSIAESKYKYKAVHWLEEMARANTAFKFAGHSALPVERMDGLVSGYLKYRKAHFGVLVQQTVSVIAFKTLVVGTLLVLGIMLVQSNQITLGQFVASEIVIVTVLAGIEKLVFSLATAYDMLTAVDKLGHVTDLPLEPTGGLALRDRGGAGLALAARGLTYRYLPGAAPAVRDVSLAVAPGERVGITGYEGSGQTTLLKIVAGLLDGYEGALSADGVPLRDLDRAGYRDAVGQLLSPTDLFDGTVEENVAVGRTHVTPHDVLRALERVGLAEWIQAQPGGLGTPITNGGRGLPTHVVSQLLVAQAIVGRPRLVVVDDYYQNVEPDHRRRLVDCLTRRDGGEAGWTLLLVSHDPAFLSACDRVLLLEEGRVARDGPFQQLVAESPFLQRLVQQGSPALR